MLGQQEMVNSSVPIPVLTMENSRDFKIVKAVRGELITLQGLCKSFAPCSTLTFTGWGSAVKRPCAVVQAGYLAVSRQLKASIACESGCSCRIATQTDRAVQWRRWVGTTDFWTEKKKQDTPYCLEL